MKTSKILTLIMAIVMMLTIALPLTANAAGGKINITATDSVAGKTFYAYQIFDVEVTTDGTGFFYTLNSDYTGFETHYAATMSPETTLKAYIMSFLDTSGNVLPSKQDALEDLARALWNWSEANNATNKILSATGTGTGVSFTGLEAGYYVVAGGAMIGGSSAKTFAALCTVLDDVSKTTDVTFKADVPTITKEVKNHINGTWQKWTDVSITEQAQFKLTSTVPDTQYYKTYTYKVHDNMSAGLTFDNIVSVTAYKAGNTSPQTLALNGGGTTEYTFAAPGADKSNAATSFTVTIPSATIKSLSANGYETIEIISNTTLNSDAVIEQNGNPNYVKLEYSSDPNWVGDGQGGAGDVSPTEETPQDDAWVYTYKLDVFKYTGTNIPLPGVKFQLLNAAGTQAAKFNVPSTGPNAGKNVFAGWTSTMDDATTILISGNPNGMIYMVGIDAGNYKLHEYAVPPGYNSIDDIDVTVINANDSGDIMAYLAAHYGEATSGNSLVSYPGNTGVAQVAVYNGSGPKFPGTGGNGRTLFFVGGLLIIGLLAAAFVIYKKRSVLSEVIKIQ